MVVVVVVVAVVSSYNCTPFFHALLTKGKKKEHGEPLNASTNVHLNLVTPPAAGTHQSLM